MKPKYNPIRNAVITIVAAGLVALVTNGCAQLTEWNHKYSGDAAQRQRYHDLKKQGKLDELNKSADSANPDGTIVYEAANIFNALR
jgi:hypothetical protein